MKLKITFLILIIITAIGCNCDKQNVRTEIKTQEFVEDEKQIRAIFDDELNKGKCYENLRTLCSGGSRLSGSKEAANAVQWGKNLLQSMNLDSVYLQDIMVPHWVRGEKEFAEIRFSNGKKEQTRICALGGSVGTPKDGITAEVIEVFGLEDLEKLGEEKIKGKIVFYNRPMKPTHINTFDAYGGCVDQRGGGASEAAKYGAVASLVRSMNLRLDNFPHTGGQGYKDTTQKIPTAAISTNGAEYLSKMLKEDAKLKFYLKMNCETLPDATSHNVIGEIKGSKYPDEVIVIGGHLDSWDAGTGAHDDGAGIVQSVEILNIFKSLGLKPERTIRCVMFMNEENGCRGAEKYAELAKANKNEKHLAAIESDRGGFAPRGFSVDGTDTVKNKCYTKIMSWRELFKPYGIHQFEQGFSGVDVSRLKDQDIALIGFIPDSQRYFDFHHADTDNFDGVNKRELELGAASIASLVYLLSKYGL